MITISPFLVIVWILHLCLWVHLDASDYVSISGDYTCDSSNDCSDKLLVCTKEESDCSITCSGQYYCKNTQLYSAAASTTLNCDSYYACQDMSIYCGDLSIANDRHNLNFPDGLSLSDFVRNTSDIDIMTCEIVPSYSSGFYNGFLGCYGDIIDQCTMTSDNYYGLNTVTFECDTKWNSDSDDTDCVVTCDSACSVTLNCYASEDDESSQCDCTGDYGKYSTYCSIDLFEPSAAPSSQPSIQPTVSPSAQPSNKPSNKPTNSPINSATNEPSKIPTDSPLTTRQPSNIPSINPSARIDNNPTMYPSIANTQSISNPTMTPTTTAINDKNATNISNTDEYNSVAPTKEPSFAAIISNNASETPTLMPVESDSSSSEDDGAGNDTALNSNDNNESIESELIEDIEWVIALLVLFCVCGICLLLAVLFYKKKLKEAKAEIANVKSQKNNNDNNNNNEDFKKPLLSENAIEMQYARQGTDRQELEGSVSHIHRNSKKNDNNNNNNMEMNQDAEGMSGDNVVTGLNNEKNNKNSKNNKNRNANGNNKYKNKNHINNVSDSEEISRFSSKLFNQIAVIGVHESEVLNEMSDDMSNKQTIGSMDDIQRKAIDHAKSQAPKYGNLSPNIDSINENSVNNGHSLLAPSPKLTIGSGDEIEDINIGLNAMSSHNEFENENEIGNGNNNDDSMNNPLLNDDNNNKGKNNINNNMNDDDNDDMFTMGA